MCFNPHPASLPGDASEQVAQAAALPGFNPHPASLPGDAPNRRRRYANQPVSIRTRHRCRVMHGVTVETRFPRGFNPHPASLPGDAAYTRLTSTHPWVSIRTRHRCRVMRVCAVCYHVRPIVSIRTRHRCRVMPIDTALAGTRYAFQSAPGIAAG